jgi:hypothetical protein
MLNPNRHRYISRLDVLVQYKMLGRKKKKNNTQSEKRLSSKVKLVFFTLLFSPTGFFYIGCVCASFGLDRNDFVFWHDLIFSLYVVFFYGGGDTQTE